jgi:hypothetical protein
VIHRVKKIPGVRPPALTEKTRTWSIAISTITTPRTMSIETTRRAALALARRSAVKPMAAGVYSLTAPVVIDIGVSFPFGSALTLAEFRADARVV